jgi:7-carboxy-7-deazaguanine synthase
MSYAVKSIFKTIQGEGFHAGRVALFVRFSGCNLWSGREADRGQGGSCSAWCDTDFVGIDGANGGRYGLAALLLKCSEIWGLSRLARFVVLTGGEPALQVDQDLIDGLHRFGFEVAIETNGTKPLPKGIDWITVSPKASALLHQLAAAELKLVYPQDGAEPERFKAFTATYRFLQPMDGPRLAENQDAAVAYCLDNPEWRISNQIQKELRIS